MIFNRGGFRSFRTGENGLSSTSHLKKVILISLPCLTIETAEMWFRFKKKKKKKRKEKKIFPQEELLVSKGIQSVDQV
jgi:hypothetical protein